MTAPADRPAATRPPDVLIDWCFLDPEGNRCGPPRYGDDILMEAHRLAREADADADFTALVVDFSEVRYRLPWRLVLRRVAWHGTTGVFLGYRQAGGSYSREGS